VRPFRTVLIHLVLVGHSMSVCEAVMATKEMGPVRTAGSEEMVKYLVAAIHVGVYLPRYVAAQDLGRAARMRMIEDEALVAAE
jgi:hypothetical protein